MFLQGKRHFVKCQKKTFNGVLFDNVKNIRKNCSQPQKIPSVCFTRLIEVDNLSFLITEMFLFLTLQTRGNKVCKMCNERIQKGRRGYECGRAKIKCKLCDAEIDNSVCYQSLTLDTKCFINF